MSGSNLSQRKRIVRSFSKAWYRSVRCMDRPPTIHIQRREFIATLGSAVVWPLAARAQPAGRLPTIGFLGATTPGVPQFVSTNV
jgi:hypothetical protein